jgi:hypothetical protein
MQSVIEIVASLLTGSQESQSETNFYIVGQSACLTADFELSCLTPSFLSSSKSLFFLQAPADTIQRGSFSCAFFKVQPIDSLKIQLD